MKNVEPLTEELIDDLARCGYYPDIVVRVLEISYPYGYTYQDAKDILEIYKPYCFTSSKLK